MAGMCLEWWDAERGMRGWVKMELERGKFVVFV
jgi:hypothetical protein